jgi:hypothetical protein
MIKVKKHKSKPKKNRPKKPNRLDDPSQVTAPRTLRGIYRDANTATGLRYGQEEQALRLNAAQTAPWFEQYKGQVAANNAGVQAGYAKAIQDVAARTAATQAAGDTSRKQSQDQAQKDAASRGASIDPSVFAQDAAGANVRRQGEDAFANVLTAGAQAQNSYFGGVQSAAGSAQLAQQQQNANLIRGLQAEKGQFRSGYVTDARQTEHKNQLENQAFGLDVAKEQNDLLTAAAQRRTTTRNQKAQRKASSRNERNTVITSGPYAGLTHGQVRKLTPDQKAQRLKQSEKPKAKKPLSAAGLKAKQNIRSGVHQLRKHDNGLGDYWKGAYDELVSENGLDPVVARAIVQGARTGRLGPKTAKQLRDDYGITGLSFGKGKRRPKPRTVNRPPNAPGVHGQMRPT